jgi:hypothetical protein
VAGSNSALLMAALAMARQSWASLALCCTKLDGVLIKTKRGSRRFLLKEKNDGGSCLSWVAVAAPSS